MSLAWRILLFALLLNVVTVGGLQIVVYQAQQQWFDEQRRLGNWLLGESFAELEQLYAPDAVEDAAGNEAVVRRLLRTPSLREAYEDVIVTRGRPPFDGIYLNTLGAVHRDPDRFRLEEIVAGMARARGIDGVVKVAGGYCRRLRHQGRTVGYLWFVPKFERALPTTLPFWTTLLGLLASAALFGFVLFWLTRRLVTRPLADVGEAARAVAAGRYDVRLPDHGAVPELGPLVATFNRMCEQVEDHTRTLERAVREAVAATEQKERALLLSSRLATIGTLAAGVAHEINNPIGGMQNAVNRLLQSDGLTDKQRVYLQLVQDGLQRVARTSRRMLEFAPKDARPAPFALRAAIDGAYALVEHRCRQAGVRCTVHGADGLPPVHGDAHELQQVMLNLFLNSLDALGDRGGCIAVECSHRDGVVRCVVSDDGPGIAPELIERIFDPFFTNKDRPDASGLGMFISYSIVQNHGGTMRVESRPGEGFRTIIELPQAPGAAGAGRANAGDQASDAAGSPPSEPPSAPPPASL
ncbi:MAG TPA: HAMP domain-containing histidine kinase [bacterium]|nr:HAMP domain-containing histidine kinase [bacterium]